MAGDAGDSPEHDEAVSTEVVMREWDDRHRDGGSDGPTAPTSAGREGLPLGAKLIKGMQGETPVIICPWCMKDVPTRDWRAHDCAQGARDVQGHVVAEEPRDDPLGHMHDEQRVDPWAMGATEAVWYEIGGDDEEGWRPIDAFQGQGEGARCARCLTLLGGHGMEWRICTCFAIACRHCWGEECINCGGNFPQGGSDNRSTDISNSCGVRHDLGNVCASATGSGGPAGGSEGAGLRQPPEVDPRGALRLRSEAMDRRREALREKRKLSHEVRKMQYRNGPRPRREKSGGPWFEIVTANVSAASTLLDELEFGTSLGTPRVILVQELATDPDGGEAFANKVSNLGYTPVIEHSYYKDRGYGGGVAILTPGIGGARPQQPPAEHAKGRLVCGVIDMGLEVTGVCIYGITGGKLAAQLPLWKEMAAKIRLLGRPFCAGGDWQVSPQEMAGTGIEALLDARIVAPPNPTNFRTGTKIDYFLISRALIEKSTTASTIHGCRFSPHLPVRVQIRARATIPRVRRLSLPRMFPIERPVGPQLPPQRVRWEQWASSLERQGGEGGAEQGKHIVEEASKEWHAGVELELRGVFGCGDEDVAGPYLGIGAPRHVVENTAERMFRHTPDWQGLVGHRLAWTSRHLHMVSRHAQVLQAHGKAAVQQHGMGGAAFKQARAAAAVRKAASGVTRTSRAGYVGDAAAASHGLPGDYMVLRRIGLRAAALCHEKSPLLEEPEDKEYLIIMRMGLKRLAALARAVHGRVPLIDHWSRGGTGDDINQFAEMGKEVEAAAQGLAARRGNQQLKAAKRWAASATSRVAHRVTKNPVATTLLSASPSKLHLGAIGPQEAADQGLRDWSEPWRARNVDESEQVLREVEAVGAMPRSRWGRLPTTMYMAVCGLFLG